MSAAAQPMKTCTKCGETKPLDAFGSNGRGHRKKSACKQCHNAAQRAYDQSEKGKATKRVYNHSAEGKANRYAYRHSEKGKATRYAYAQSEKGILSRRYSKALLLKNFQEKTKLLTERQQIAKRLADVPHVAQIAASDREQLLDARQIFKMILNGSIPATPQTRLAVQGFMTRHPTIAD